MIVQRMPATVRVVVAMVAGLAFLGAFTRAIFALLELRICSTKRSYVRC